MLTTNPLRKAVSLAENHVDDLGYMFSRAGIAENEGRMKSLYRQAKHRLLIASSLKEIRDATDVLVDGVRGLSSSFIEEAWRAGGSLASNQLQAYGEKAKGVPFDLSKMRVLTEAVVQRAQAQVGNIYALSLVGENKPILFGRQDKEDDFGMMSPAFVEISLAAIMVEASTEGWETYIKRNTREVYKKIAVAQVDNKTTRCCLKVNGQIQDIDKPFHTTETPAWADWQDAPPFHWYCRTALALYDEMWDDGISVEMMTAATIELDRRSRSGNIGGQTT
jgi:hypothetical protein